MAASVRLQAVAHAANNAIRQVHGAMSSLHKAVDNYNQESLSAELNGLATGATVTADGQIDKERCLQLIILGATLLYELDSLENPGNNTILGTAPLDTATLRQYMDATSVG